MDVEQLIGYLPQALGDAGFKVAAYFGSVAKGTYDEYSDVDMIVCSNDLSPENFIINLSTEFGKVLFRPFFLTVDGKLAPQSGRYWFNNLSPFCKIDVSFYDRNEFNHVIRKGSDFVSGPYKMIVCHSGKRNIVINNNFKQTKLPPEIDLYKWLRLSKTLYRGSTLDNKDRELLMLLTQRITEFLNMKGFYNLSDSVVKLYSGAQHFASAESQGGAAFSN
jgi:predicted nucleotidyltransferase